MRRDRPPLPPVPDDTPGPPLDPDDDEAEGEIASDVPDDPGGDLVPHEPRDPDVLPDLSVPDDADDGTWEPEAEVPEPELASDAGEPEVLGWSATARLPAWGAEVPAILDPTTPRSEWIVPRGSLPAGVSSLALEVVIGRFHAEVPVTLREGDEPHLRLGRDALAGRVLVRP